MSTIIIIGGGTKPTLAAQGSTIVDGDGVVVAQFQTPEQAIAYLKAIKKPALEGAEE